MKRTTLFLAVAASAVAVVAIGCSDEAGTTGSGGASSSTTASAGGGTTTATTGTATSTTATTGSGGAGGSGGGISFPTPPTLGAQIDRFGRPAVNTALNHAFDSMPATKDAAKDAWNADGDPTKWVASNAAEVAKNLAILDSLDTNCGNQLLAGPDPVTGRYDGLAGVLADDRVWLKTDAVECKQYLAVELNATAIALNGDCGGRKLDYDVIATTYSALAIGQPAGVDDGVPADADTAGTAFPYLAGPH